MGEAAGVVDRLLTFGERTRIGFMLFALMATLLLRRFSSTLEAHPALLEPVVHTYLLCLGFADLTHIVRSSLPTPPFPVMPSN